MRDKDKKKKKKRLEEEDIDLLDDRDIDERKADAEEEEAEREKQERQSRREQRRRDREEFDYVIRHTHDSKMAKILRSRGVSPLDIMHGQKAFNLEDVVQPISSQAFGRVKKISANKQLNWYESSYRRVLGQSWLSAGIGGHPTDARAKQLALHLFMKAIQEYQSRDPRKNANRSLPLWHHVYGGFGDSLRDMKSDFPSFIVISNLTPECTSIKFEKVRDCLTKFNNMDIPVLVVCAGMDPYTLFATKLYYPMRWGINVGNKIVEM